MEILIRATIGLTLLVSLGAYSNQIFGVSGHETAHTNATSLKYRAPHMNIVALVARSDVKSELKIDKDQAKTIDALVAKFRDEKRRWIDLMPILGMHSRSLTQSEMILENARQIQAVAVESSEQQIYAVLTRMQCERLDQIQIQRGGLASLHRRDVAARLMLTKDQLEGLNEIPSPMLSCSVFPKERLRANAQLTGLMTPRQRMEWLRIKGADFAFEDIKPDSVLVY